MRAFAVACALLIANTSAARAGDPFQTAPAPTADSFRAAAPQAAIPKPAPRPRPAPESEPEPVVAVPPPPPRPSALEVYEGLNGVWRVKAYRVGHNLTGEIECLSFGKWSKGPRFEATVDPAGNFSVLAKPNGWPIRQISGVFPQLNIHAVNFDKYLNCPDGGVTLQKKSAPR